MADDSGGAKVVPFDVTHEVDIDVFLPRHDFPMMFFENFLCSVFGDRTMCDENENYHGEFI